MKIKNIILLMLFVVLISSISAIEVPSEINIFSGDTYNGEVIVKNLASNPASFILSITCNDQVSATATELYFEANEEKGIPFQLSGTNTNQEPLITTCTYTVIDRKGGTFGVEEGIVIVNYDGNNQENIQTTNTIEKQGNNFLLYFFIAVLVLVLILVFYYLSKKK